MEKVKLILCDITRYMKTFKDQVFTEPLIGQIAVDYQFVTSNPYEKTSSLISCYRLL